MEMMRLTAFPASGPRPITPPGTLETWWASLFGVSHDRSNQDRRDGVTQLLGSVGDYFMVATENPVSLEYKQLAGDPGEPPRDPDTMPFYSSALPVIIDLALRWLAMEHVPPLRRLAFGAALLKPVADREEGYRTLDRHLPYVGVDPSSTDFIYQINRLRPSSAVDGLFLNRLSKWSTRQVLGIALSPDGRVSRHSTTFACRLDVDINSVPSDEILPTERLSNLFTELTELATEIARDGDVL